jgi:hypothetical protein
MSCQRSNGHEIEQPDLVHAAFPIATQKVVHGGPYKYLDIACWCLKLSGVLHDESAAALYFGGQQKA